MPMRHGWSRVALRVRAAPVRGCALEGDPDAAAHGVFDGLFGPVVETVVLQAATGRSQGGEVGIREHACPPDRRTRRTIEGSIVWMRMQKVCSKQGEEGEGTKGRDVLAFRRK